MTPEEATTIVKMLCDGFRKELPPEQVKAFARRLLDLDYDRARKGVDYVLDTEERFPSIARFKLACRGLYEGSPNAQAYYGTPSMHEYYQLERIRRWIEHEERLIAMSDEEYEQYLIEYGRLMQERKRHQLREVRL